MVLEVSEQMDFLTCDLDSFDGTRSPPDLAAVFQVVKDALQPLDSTSTAILPPTTCVFIERDSDAPALRGVICVAAA